MIIGRLTRLCNHHHYLLLEYFHYPMANPVCIKESHPSLLHPQAPYQVWFIHSLVDKHLGYFQFFFFFFFFGCGGQSSYERLCINFLCGCKFSFLLDIYPEYVCSPMAATFYIPTKTLLLPPIPISRTVSPGSRVPPELLTCIYTRTQLLITHGNLQKSKIANGQSTRCQALLWMPCMFSHSF